MYVCICNAVTERAIHDAARCGVRTLDELTVATGCAGNCGSCRELACAVLEQVTAGASSSFAPAAA